MNPKDLEKNVMAIDGERFQPEPIQGSVLK
jgi:hypothetical protein